MTKQVQRAVAASTGTAAASTSGAGHVWLAVVLVFIVALRVRLPLGLTPGLLVGTALLPVTIAVLPRARRLGATALLFLAAAVSGVLLTMYFAADGPWSPRNFVSGSVRLLSVPVTLICLMWARSVIGTRRMIQVFATGLLVSVLLVGINADNPWKFSFSVPLTLLVLSLSWIYRQRAREFVALLLLTLVSVLNDSRSAAAMMLIAAVLLVAQSRVRSTPRRMGAVLLQISLTATAGYLATQALIREGALGEAARARTEMQVQQSGSVLVGGRPEIGASFALIRENPLGFGPGTLVTYDNLLVAKSGMASLNYDPNNGYVESYMFGSGYEVHSVIGDLWLWFGPLGLAVAMVIAGAVLQGMASAISRGAATGALLYLALRTLWDLPFSPYPSALLTLALALAVCWPLQEARSGPCPPVRGQSVR